MIDDRELLDDHHGCTEELLRRLCFGKIKSRVKRRADFNMVPQ